MKRCRQTGKHCQSEGKAEAQLRSIHRIKPDYDGRVYFCLFCGHYHVGRERQGAHKNKYKDKR